MFFYLLLLFTVIPACELALLIKVGTIIGVGNTLLLIVFTGVVGAALARYQGFVVLGKIQENLNRGIMPSEELIDGLMILVGGIVLLTPGFITDSLGFLLLFPLSRSLIKHWLKSKLKSIIERGEVVSFSAFGGKRFKDLDDGNSYHKRFDDIDIE